MIMASITYSNIYTKKDYKYAQDNDLNWIGEDGANVETVFAIRYSAKATWDNPWRERRGLSLLQSVLLPRYGG